MSTSKPSIMSCPDLGCCAFIPSIEASSETPSLVYISKHMLFAEDLQCVLREEHEMLKVLHGRNATGLLVLQVLAVHIPPAQHVWIFGCSCQSRASGGCKSCITPGLNLFKARPSHSPMVSILMNEWHATPMSLHCGNAITNLDCTCHMPAIVRETDTDCTIHFMPFCSSEVQSRWVAAVFLDVSNFPHA